MEPPDERRRRQRDHHPQVLQTDSGLVFLGTKIGEGSFAKVYEGRSQDGQAVAVKVVDKSRLTPAIEHFIRREMRISVELHHPNIVEVLHVSETPEKVNIVMRLASGDLLQHVNERSPLAEIESRHIFRQLVAAMDYVHQTGVIHRDLKLENILLTYRGGDLSVPVVLVADWGFATRYEPGQRMQTEKVGSLSYCAPELLSGLLYIGPEVDIWSMGVILYALMFGALPFSHPDVAVRRQYIGLGFYQIPTECQPHAAHLLQRLMCVNPLQRASMAEVRNHQWMTDLPRRQWARARPSTGAVASNNGGGGSRSSRARSDTGMNVG